MSEYSITPEGEAASQDNAEVDVVKLERLMQDMKSKQNLPFAIAAGLIASVIAAFIWATVTYITNYQIGFMAIGVGFLVGYAVNFFGKGLTVTFGIVGAVFSLIGCLLGNLLMTIIAASRLEDSSTAMVMTVLLTSPGIILEIMKETFSPIDLLFYAIAVYEGYRFSIRQISEEELASVQKTPISTEPISTEPEK